MVRDNQFFLTFVFHLNLYHTTGEVAVQSVGNSQLVRIVQPVIAINYIICLDGLYPMRP